MAGLNSPAYFYILIDKIFKMWYNMPTNADGLTRKGKFMKNINGFMIDESGLLHKYTGNETKIIVPDGVVSIVEEAFYKNTSITSVTLPASLTDICADAFHGCSSLESINIPASVEYIGEMAFFCCYALKTAVFENTKGWTAGAYNPYEGEREEFDLTSNDLSDPSKAAKYLREYDAYNWERG